MVGIIDTGASFSVVNWAGAALLGLPIRGDAKYKNAPTIFGVGVDGKPMPLPTQKVPLTFSGRELPREQVWFHNFPECSLNVPWMFDGSSLDVHRMFPDCSLPPRFHRASTSHDFIFL
jgi:hypothetical protein